MDDNKQNDQDKEQKKMCWLGLALALAQLPITVHHQEYTYILETSQRLTITMADQNLKPRIKQTEFVDMSRANAQMKRIG